MSLIHLQKQGDHWRSRVEGHFILGAHPIETVRKGLPEAMAQAVVDHCAMSGEDVAAFAQRLTAEIAALAPVKPIPDAIMAEAVALNPYDVGVAPAEPRSRSRVRRMRSRAAVAPEAEQALGEPPDAPKEDI